MHAAIDEAPEDSPEWLRGQAFEARLQLLKETDMAVVVSQGQNEIAELAAKGLDIRPHRKRTLNEQLKGKLAQKLMAVVRQNRTRIDYLDRFQALIDAYNAGSLNAEAFFEELVELAERLPDAYSPELFEEKAGVVFQRVYETYYGGGGSVYAQTA